MLSKHHRQDCNLQEVCDAVCVPRTAEERRTGWRIREGPLEIENEIGRESLVISHSHRPLQPQLTRASSCARLSSACQDSWKELFSARVCLGLAGSLARPLARRLPGRSGHSLAAHASKPQAMTNADQL
jgi:hypothetical protein